MNAIIRYHDRYGQPAARAVCEGRRKNIESLFKGYIDEIEGTLYPLSSEFTLDEFIRYLLRMQEGEDIIFVDSQSVVIAEGIKALNDYKPSDSEELNAMMYNFERVQLMDCEITISGIMYLIYGIGNSWNDNIRRIVCEK